MAECWLRIMERSERDVMLVMCDHADDSGNNAYPSIARIAWKTDLSTRQVSRVIKTLVAKGALKLVRHAGRRTPNAYRVVLSVLPKKPDFRDDTMSPHESLGVTSETFRGDISDVRGDIAMSPEPSVQPSVQPSTEKKARDATKRHPSILQSHDDQRVSEYLSLLRPNGEGITGTNAKAIMSRVALEHLPIWVDVLARWATAQWRPTNFEGMFDSYDRAVNAQRVAAERGTPSARNGKPSGDTPESIAFREAMRRAAMGEQ